MKPHHLPLAAALLAGCVAGAQAQATIDQNKALAGYVTPGDAPGFPVTISQPGSYRLTGNLTVPDANTTAIVVTSPNVTLDLGGYAVLGPCASDCGAGTGDGIAMSLPHTTISRLANISVSNGTVSGMGRYGISSINIGAGGNYDMLLIDRMRVLSNRQIGVVIVAGATISNSDIIGNGNLGVSGNSVALRNNVIRRNGGAGLLVNVSSTALGNVIQLNASDSLAGARNLGGNLCGNALCP